MTYEEKLINKWRNRCVRSKNIPIALVTVDKDGYLVVFSDHKSETLSELWRYLATSSMIGEKTHLEDQEN